MRFAHAQERTALFIESLCAFEEQRRRLEANNEIPAPYKDMEMQRLRFSCYIALHRYGKTLAVPFTKPESPMKIDGYVRDTLAVLQKPVNNVSRAFREAVAEVDHFRTKIEVKNLDPVRFARSEFAHERAETALKQGSLSTEEVCKRLERSPAPDPIEVLRDISIKLRDANREVRKMLEPSQNFLSSVLDRELAACRSVPIAFGCPTSWRLRRYL